MKVLFLSNASSVHTVRWVNALAARGHEIHLVYKPDHGPENNIVLKDVILHEMKYSGTKGYFLNARLLKKISSSIQPNLINAHYASGYGTLARIAKLKPLVLSVWGSDVYQFPYQSKIKMKIIVDNLKYADIIASTSHCMAEQTKRILKSHDKDIQITPFGVDLSKFCGRIEREKKRREKIVVGNIKSLEEIYGIEYLIKAIRILLDNLYEIGRIDIVDILEVRLYGDGSKKECLTELVKSLGIERHIKFLGLIPNSEVPDALEKIDIFCATSNQESFGVSLIEAMAMEIPIVSTDADGFIEINKDRVTGIIVEKQNPTAIAEALTELILDEDLREQMGKAARARVIDLYNWDNNVGEMIKIYINLTNK